MSYDANGNITKYKRNKDAGITQDSLNYKYNAGTNQLQYITDNVASNVSTTDIDNQSPNNYIYDKSGNMVADNSQSMSVSWSPYGKILQNNKAGGANLTFGYNAMQQRVLKRVVLAGDTTRTYYIRDAQGNTMGVYTRHNDSVTWREQYIFGSSRLGLYRADTLVNKGLQVISKLYEGKRNYELTNHLGNVMAVINDRKTDSLSGTTKVGYNAVVISATDYYPFGMAIDSRSYTSSLYRYGFNGKENDKETGEQDYGERMYDSKVPHFLSVDPITKKYPEYSPYIFAGGNPIKFVDLDGTEPWFDERTRTAKPPVLQTINDQYYIKVFLPLQMPAIYGNPPKPNTEVYLPVGVFKKGEYKGSFTSIETAFLESVYYADRHAREALRSLPNEKAYIDLDTKKYGAYDCITSVLAGLNMTGVNYRKYNTEDVGGDMGKYINKLYSNGLAGDLLRAIFNADLGQFTSFYDKAEKKVFSGSVSEQVRASIGGKKGVHLFGVSINGGEHSATILVDNMNDNGTEAGSTMKFKLFDQSAWYGELSEKDLNSTLGNWSAKHKNSEEGIRLREIKKPVKR